MEKTKDVTKATRPTRPCQPLSSSQAHIAKIKTNDPPAIIRFITNPTSPHNPRHYTVDTPTTPIPVAKGITLSPSCRPWPYPTLNWTERSINFEFHATTRWERKVGHIGSERPNIHTRKQEQRESGSPVSSLFNPTNETGLHKIMSEMR